MQNDDICITIGVKGGMVERLFQNSVTGKREEVNSAAGRVYLKYIEEFL